MTTIDAMFEFTRETPGAPMLLVYEHSAVLIRVRRVENGQRLAIRLPLEPFRLRLEPAEPLVPSYRIPARPAVAFVRWPDAPPHRLTAEQGWYLLGRLDERGDLPEVAASLLERLGETPAAREASARLQGTYDCLWWVGDLGEQLGARLRRRVEALREWWARRP